MTTGSRRRIGLVGCGSWGRLILRDLRELEAEVEVVARSPESVQRATEHGANRIVPSHEELGEVDGIVVATPDDTHASVVGELLDRELPIYCQKPLTLDPQSAAPLVAAADGRLFVMEAWRYHAGVEAIRDIVASGELGRLTGLRSLRWGWGLNHATSDPTYHLMPHDLSIAREITGGIPPARHARAACMGGKPIELMALLGGEDGPWVDLEISVARHRRRREVRALFERGVAWLDQPYAEAIGLASADGLGHEPEWRPIDSELPVRRQLRAFLRYLQDAGPAPKSSGEEALESLQRLAELRELAGLPRAFAEV